MEEPEFLALLRRLLGQFYDVGRAEGTPSSEEVHAIPEGLPRTRLQQAVPLRLLRRALTPSTQKKVLVLLVSVQPTNTWLELDQRVSVHAARGGLS
jgi:hypothetical protein